MTDTERQTAETLIREARACARASHDRAREAMASAAAALNLAQARYDRAKQSLADAAAELAQWEAR